METLIDYSTVNGVKNTFRGNHSYFTVLLKTYPLFIELIKALPYRRIVVVKPRDLCIYMGICDHHKLTWMGMLLSFLEKQGLARRHNNSRPTRYTLSKEFAVIKQICGINEHGEDYCVEKGCGFLGLCPYWMIKNLRSEKNGDL